MDSQKFEMYALVELFGHQKIAGLVSEQVVAGQACPGRGISRRR